MLIRAAREIRGQTGFRSRLALRLKKIAGLGVPGPAIEWWPRTGGTRPLPFRNSAHGVHTVAGADGSATVKFAGLLGGARYSWPLATLLKVRFVRKTFPFR